MERVSRIAMGAVLRAGPVGLAYVLLTPSVWTTSDFSVLWVGAALATGGAIREESSATTRVESWPVWLGSRLLVGLGMTSIFVAGSVLLSAVLGESTLRTTDQRFVFIVAALTAVLTVVWLVRPRRRQSKAAELKSAERRAEVRVNIRREIENIETSAKAERDITRSD